MGYGYRLPASLQADLSSIWNDCEAAMGVRSSLGGQIAQLERSAPPDKPMPGGCGPARPASASPSPSRRRTRSAAKTAGTQRMSASVLYWETIEPCTRTRPPKPTEFLGSFSGQRARESIDRTIRTLIKSPNGIANQRILFVVYGNPFLRPPWRMTCTPELEVFSIRPGERRRPCSRAPRGPYAAAHDEVADAARDTRRARLDRLLGAVGA